MNTDQRPPYRAFGGGWEYRVIASPHTIRTGDYDEVEYGLHEVYYDAHGRICAWSERPIAPGGGSFDELDDDLELMRAALNKPPLDLETLVREMAQSGAEVES